MLYLQSSISVYPLFQQITPTTQAAEAPDLTVAASAPDVSANLHVANDVLIHPVIRVVYQPLLSLLQGMQDEHEQQRQA